MKKVFLEISKIHWKAHVLFSNKVTGLGPPYNLYLFFFGIN